MSEYLTDSLNQRYRATLVLVAFLVLLNQLLVQPSLMRLTTDAPVINIAGRQRMLSQRLAKAALALESKDVEARDRYSDELERVLRLWTTAHDGLRNGDAAMSLPGGNSQAVNAALDGLEPLYLRMRTAAERLIRDDTRGQPDSPAARDDLAAILGAEAEYLERMDKVVGLFEREARDRVGRMFWTGWVVMGLILLALAGVGLLIVKPAVDLIRRQVEELRRGRDELEDRVRQRTRELEDRHGTAPGPRGTVQSRRTNDHDWRNGQWLGSRAQSTAGSNRQLRRGVSGRASHRPSRRSRMSRAALEKLLAATLRTGKIIERIRKFVTRHELETRTVRAEPDRRGGSGHLPGGSRPAGRRSHSRLGTRFAKGLRRPGSDPAGARQPGQRMRSTRSRRRNRLIRRCLSKRRGPSPAALSSGH